MDDDQPVDAAIRPVLPSRAGAESVPAFLIQPPPGTEPRKGRRPPQRRKEISVKKPKRSKRSAAASVAWKTRRENMKTALQAAMPEVDPLHPLLRLLEVFRDIPADKRAHAITILQGLLS